MVIEPRVRVRRQLLFVRKPDQLQVWRLQGGTVTEVIAVRGGYGILLVDRRGHKLSDLSPLQAARIAQRWLR